MKRENQAQKAQTVLRTCLCFCLFMGSLGSAIGQRVNDVRIVRRYEQLITPDRLASRLYFFASDHFEGRETGTRGQKLAAEYLASEYRQLGLAPGGSDKASDPRSPSPYFQSFTVYRRTPRQTRLEVTIEGKNVASSVFSGESHDELSFFSVGALSAASGPVVFGGHGTAEDFAELSAKQIKLTSQWLLLLEDETQFINKRSRVWKAGPPAGVLIVSNANSFAERAAQASLAAQRLGNLSLVEKSDFPPTFIVSTKLADQLLAPSKQAIESLKNSKRNVFELDRSVKVSAAIEPTPSLRTENVLAFIEGSDPKLKDEVLIISSHYDHLGINSALKGDQIFNGAADDGSGVVASLELAHWFMQAKRDGFGPRRSILFINFTGEERGLLGSTYYSHHPVVPWEKTVADINMDGVGGLDPKHPTNSKNYIYILGTDDLSTELIGITKDLNRTLAINLDLTPAKGFNSDQYNFETQFIPYLYYSTGFTEKYHQPSDEPDTIDYEHFTRVVRLIFATAWQVANQEKRVQSVDRSRLTHTGYTCPPCPFACDDHTFAQPGECPVCGMALVPKYKLEPHDGTKD